MRPLNGKEMLLLRLLPMNVVTFGVVYKILTRSYVSEDDINASKDCIDFFGPFRRSDILVDLSLERDTGLSSDECANNGCSNRAPLKCANCKAVSYCSKQCQASDWKAGHKRDCKKLVSKKARRANEDGSAASKLEDFDSSLIVCESEARMRAVASAALALGETEYVPFKMLFVEGVLEANCEEEISAVEVPMMAAACLLGDHDNIFSLRKIVSMSSKKPKTLSEINSDHNVFKNIPASIIDSKMSNVKAGDEIKLFDFGKVEWKEKYQVLRDLGSNGYGLGLKVGLGSSGDIKSAVLNSVLHEVHDMIDKNFKTIFLPGLEVIKEKNNDGSSLFHRNDKGEVVFSAEEAERASEYIASSNLEERVKAALQKKRFVLPQEMGGVQANFCNESVYGR